ITFSLTVGIFCIQLMTAAWRRDERALAKAAFGSGPCPAPRRSQRLHRLREPPRAIRPSSRPNHRADTADAVRNTQGVQGAA
ncbi:hypothetical protein DLE01_06250, partial [Streptomyces sp. FT05W]